MSHDTSPDSTIRARLDAVCAEGWAIWEHFDLTVRERGFHPFVAADYDVVRATLEALPTRGRFLELGSASGVITVMADVLGFEAFGIELDASLVRTAREFAARHKSGAQFALGSFLPTGYRWKGASKERDSEWTGDGPSGYLQLGRALDDFDVVFGYPWRGEAPMMLDLMKQYGNPDSILLLNDTNTGVTAYRRGRPITIARPT